MKELCIKSNLKREDFKNILNSKCFIPPIIVEANLESKNHFIFIFIEFRKKYEIIVNRLLEEFWKNCDKILTEKEKDEILKFV